MTDKTFSELFMRILQQGIDEGLHKDDIIPHVALDGMFVLYASIVRRHRFKKIRITSLDLLFNTMLVYVRGLCTDRGRKEFNEHVKSLQPFGIRNPKEKTTTDYLRMN